MKILFISTHNFATNPRFYKEIILAKNHNYQVEIICFEFDNWSKNLNEELKEKLKPIKIVSIAAGRKPFFPWFMSVCSESLSRLIGKSISLPAPILSKAVSRRSYLLIKALNNVSIPDLVIGHNPGALWPTYAAAKKFNCRAGFDVEDYHPGEGHNTYLQQLSRNLMRKMLPLMNYVSFASPLIKNAVVNDVTKEKKNWFTIMNYFPSEEFIEPVELSGPIRMIWFSQNISSNRGLELVLPYIKSSAVIELHLYGNMQPAFFDEHLKGITNVHIHAPLTQQQLHQQLAMFDVGLALEPAKDRNNELAVSNKMLAYLQAGLFVLATNTEAQVDILENWPEHGYCFDYTHNNSPEILDKIVLQVKEIRKNRINRYQQFRNQNWQNESAALLEMWQQ